MMSKSYQQRSSLYNISSQHDDEIVVTVVSWYFFERFKTFLEINEGRRKSKQSLSWYQIKSGVINATFSRVIYPVLEFSGFHLVCHLDAKGQKICIGKPEMKGFRWSLRKKSPQKPPLIKPKCKTERQRSLQGSLRRSTQKFVKIIYRDTEIPNIVCCGQIFNSTSLTCYLLYCRHRQ